MRNLFGVDNQSGVGNEKGFTLIELLIVVVIVGILAVIGMPYLKEVLYGMESSRAEASFVQMLRQARNYSYISKQDVVVCTLDKFGNCGRGASAVLTAFYDTNHNNKKDAGDEIIEQSAWNLKYGEILLRTSASRDYIRYMGDTAKPRGHIGHLRYCSVSANKRLSFRVVVNMYGNVRVERGDLVEVGC